jgi:hemerythrin-like domain-containing protein
MNSLRFNLFKRAHKGLRALLADTLMLLQRTDFLINTEAKLGIVRIKMVLELMHAHAKMEDDFIFPVLNKEASSTVDYFKNQHYHDEALTLDLGIIINSFEEALTDVEREKFGNSMLSCFIEFVAFNFTHMNMEEQLINPLLWMKYTDMELMDIVGNAVKTSAIKNDHIFMQWMFMNNTNSEVGAWLRSIKEKLPFSQYSRIYDLAKAVLSPSRLELINVSLNTNEN